MHYEIDDEIALIQKVIDAGIIPKLIRILQTTDQELQYEAEWCLTNIIAAGTETQIKSTIEHDVVLHSIELLSSSSKKVMSQVR